MRHELKTVLGRLVHAGGLHHRFMGDKAAVLLFHRVDDRFPGDPITCSRREFAAFCAFLRHYYDVIALAALVERLRAGADLSGCVAITFDDGYRDNHDAAAPELQRHGLPAAFFIVTEFIGSDTVPWWDAKLGQPAEWMEWDQVRALAAAGFEIGAHTMHHADLGVVTGSAAWREITGSRDRLEAELGRRPRFFSYPYGRRHQITEANRELVRQAGFEACLSAYGGGVSRATSPWDIRRLPISPFFVSAPEVGLDIIRLPRDSGARLAAVY
jgi:peptidoglycan/xylan/chitin deacetylase (PgdA/CDA1 family)